MRQHLNWTEFAAPPCPSLYFNKLEFRLVYLINLQCCNTGQHLGPLAGKALGMQCIFTQGPRECASAAFIFVLFGHRELFCQRKQMLSDDMFVLACSRVSWSLC